MDTALISALSAVSGTLIGGMTSFASTYITQRHQVRRERLAKELDRLELLRGDFIEQAAALFLDSLDKTLDDAGGLVRLGALLSRIKLSSTEEVSKAGEQVLEEIFRAYQRPPISPRQIFAETRDTFVNPLNTFTQACRREREAALRVL